MLKSFILTTYILFYFKICKYKFKVYLGCTQQHHPVNVNITRRKVASNLSDMRSEKTIRSSFFTHRKRNSDKKCRFRRC